MSYAKVIAITVVVSTLMGAACNRPEPARESASDASAREASAREDTKTAELQRKRNDDIAQMEKRVADLERRWTEMESKIAASSATPTAALRAEVKEDVKNVREAVDGLKATTPENWWERHEGAMERTTEDIDADVRRLAGGKAAPATTSEPTTPANAAPFESRRDQFVARLTARVEAMQEQLKNVRARNARETEVEDTRARVNELKDDVERLGKASADDWWDISSKRVSEYIDRLEDSIRRLDDNKP